jgi:hypothetical protein
MGYASVLRVFKRWICYILLFYLCHCNVIDFFDALVLYPLCFVLFWLCRVVVLCLYRRKNVYADNWVMYIDVCVIHA